MSLDDDIRLIAEAPIFADLNSDQLRLLAFGAERLTAREGQVLFRQGDIADFAVVIASGEVAMTVATDAGDKLIKNATRPSLLGQLALITKTERAVTAVAANDVGVLRINQSLFHRMLREYPETAAAIHAQIRRDLEALLKDIANIEGRFARVRDL
ncbi:MAG: cyclic nucleotide-binding domain-containing protein [Pseudomonadota bacterium]